MSNKITHILAQLRLHYSDTTTALNFTNPFELLIAVILSAQCTDERTNKVTARLFPQYNAPEKLIKLTQSELEHLIHDCGLFRNKARNILAASNMLVTQYQGRLPEQMDELMQLPGVGRKTANVLLSNLFHKPAIAVDTHVFRVSRRLGMAVGDTPLKVEKELMAQIPQQDWGDAHHWLIWHGRKVCKARKPDCENCFLTEVCSYYQENN